MATKTNDFYLGNQNLPTPKATFDYGAHPEWVVDIEKCKKNILYFAENFFFIIMLDEEPPRQKIKLHPYQKKILRAFRDNRFNLVLSSRQSGKCLEASSKIKIRNKKTLQIEEVTIEEFYNRFNKPQSEKRAKINNSDKIINSFDVVDYEILSDTGWEEILQIHQTKKFDIWEVKTDTHSVKCADEHILINENHESIFAEKLKIGDKLITDSGIESVISLQQIDSAPENMYDFTINSKAHTFFSNGILSHNTTCFTIFSLWRACFVGDQRILIVANKEDTAIHILSRIKMAFENLPNYLKPGTVEWGKTSVTFGNGSSISISTTSSDTGRGQTCSILLIDEMAFIDNGILTDFWRSVYPIITSSKTAKILVASTPNGTGNLFHDLYEGAISKTENNGWHLERVDWWDVPGRDEQWKQKTIQTIGSRESFSQEFENCFLRSGESSIDTELFDYLKKHSKSPTHILDEGNYLIWKNPDPNRIYAAGVDIGEGVGAAASVIQVLDITNLKQIEQVACYSSNKITPIQFISKVNEILQHWGKPPVLIERNNPGAQVVDQLKEQFRYENIVSYGINTFNRIGVQAHTNTKYKGVINQRYWLNEMRQVIINDINTVNELHNFQRQSNGTWCAKTGEQDDRVMSLIWALMILEQEICEKYFEIVDKDKNNKPALLKVPDYSTPRAFHDLTVNVKTLRDDNYDIMPVFIRPNIHTSDTSDLDELAELGWKWGLERDK